MSHSCQVQHRPQQAVSGEHPRGGTKHLTESESQNFTPTETTSARGQGTAQLLLTETIQILGFEPPIF